MKWALTAALCLLLGLSGWFAVYSIDTGLLVEDLRTVTRSRTEQALLLRSMLQHATLNMTRPDLVRLLSDDMSSDRIVKSYEDRVEIDYVVIRFRDDKVNRVYLLGEEPDR